MNEEKLTLEQAQKTIQEVMSNKIEELKKTLTSEQQETIKTEMQMLIDEKMETLKLNNAEYVSKEDYQKLEEIVTKQGEKINSTNNNLSINPILKDFNENSYKKASQKNEKGEKGEIMSFKAFDSTNVITVNSISPSIYPSNGTTSAIGLTYRTLYAQVLGTETPPRPYSRIMDLITLEPLEAETLIVFNKYIKGKFEVTPECVMKPVVSFNYEDQSVSAEPVTANWYTTLKMRRFFPRVLNDFRNTLEQLLNEEIPNRTLDYIRKNASPFTPASGLAVHSNPNDFDAIVAVVATLKKLGYIPNGILISPVAYANMITSKGTDGHYNLSNGASIVIINGSGVLKIGAYNLPFIEDPKLGDDEFLVGDFKAIKGGVDNTIYYFETNGRTDKDDTGDSVPRTGLSVNIMTHELAQFLALLIADSIKSGLVFTTFAQVKTLITKP